MQTNYFKEKLLIILWKAIAFIEQLQSVSSDSIEKAALEVGQISEAHMSFKISHSLNSV